MSKLTIDTHTPFVKQILSKLIEKLVHKKTGCKIDLVINGLTVCHSQDTVLVHVNADASVNEKDFKKLIKLD